MKTIISSLTIAFVCLLFAVIAFFPKLGAMPIIAIQDAVSSWRIQQRNKIHAKNMAVLAVVKDELEIRALMQACANSRYDSDYAYRDAAYNLADELIKHLKPVLTDEALIAREDSLKQRMLADEKDWQTFKNYLETKTAQVR